MNSAIKIDCAHLYVVGDERCRLCLHPVREGTALTDDTQTPPSQMDGEGVDWGDVGAPEASASWSPEDYPGDKAATYPEYNDNPHNHRFTVSLAPDKPPFIVVRGNTAAEITAAFNELEAFGVYANLAAAWASLKAQGTVGAGLGPVSPVGPPQAASAPPPPSSVGYAPSAATPPPFGPNVSVPNAPGYQGPPQQPSFPSAPQPQGGGWGGSGGSGPQEKPRPAGWLMVDVPYADKQRFKGLRAQGTESGNYLRGKIQWGGKGVYWLEPSIAQWIAQQGFPVTQ